MFTNPLPGPAARLRARLGVHAAFLVLSLGLAVPIRSGSAQTPARLPLSELRGRELYRAACMSCHGSDGRGNPVSTVGFNVELPDFTDCRFSTPEPDPDWGSVIRGGGRARAFPRNMPAFGSVLSAEQIESVIAYLRTLCTDGRWPRGDLNLPRAIFTEKAFPENEAVLTTSISRDPGVIGTEIVYEHRVGTRGQYEVIVPFELQQRETGGWNRGLGDIEVSYKHALFHSIERGSILSFGAELALPTGKETRGLGSGHSVIAPLAMFGQILPSDGFVQFMGGVEFPIPRDLGAKEAFGRLALGKTFTQGDGDGRAWTPMLEALAVREMEDDAKTEWDLVPQMQVSLSTRQHILVSAGLRIPVNDNGERKRAFVMYFLWDWFDGGLFSGW